MIEKRVIVRKLGMLYLRLKGDEWQKYRKGLVVVEALQMDCDFAVKAREGYVDGKEGDWLIRGEKGKLYPCQDSEFRATYCLLSGEERDDIPG